VVLNVIERGPDSKLKSNWGVLKSRYPWLGFSVSWTVIVAGLAVVGIAAAIFVSIGGVDVSADTPDGWAARNLLHFVFKRSMAARSASLIAPDDLASPSRVRLAAQHFDMVCANCHGRPGFGQSVIALSMSPRPQYLPKVVGQFTDSELHQIVEHGVKFSAMPAWPTGARSDEVWSMVAFVRLLPKMDAKTYRDMTALPALQGASPIGAGGDMTLTPADTRRDSPPADEFLYAAPASGFSDETIHANPVATCARCHGADGSGSATGGEAPNLTLQDPAYLQAALQAYTQGKRKSGFMQNIAAQLSSAQIAALAHYYAGLPARSTPSSPADPALIKQGEAIALEGIRESATPACSNCHESHGETISGAPHIAGQSAIYLRRQLSAMGRGDRGSSHWWNPMPAVAHGLSNQDIAAVAAYYSSLAPAKATGGQVAQHSQVPTSGKIDLAAAKDIFETQCLKCHVNEGRGDLEGNYPDLTLQTTPFVAQSLYAFRSGARPGDKMRQVTGGLTFDELASLARYVSSLTPRAALAKVDLAAASRGAAIATHGNPTRGVPACLSCHGASAVADLPLIPRLQGQSAPYLRARLDRFSEPYASNLSALNPMPMIASRLTKEERADLAAYFANTAPLPKAAPGQ
jgi:cytochrome c553